MPLKITGGAVCRAAVLPRIYDPPEGFIATANEKLEPTRGPQLVTLPVPDYRKRRIVERLAAMSQATIDDMQKLQYERRQHAGSRSLGGAFCRTCLMGRLSSGLSVWDYSYGADSVEATLLRNGAAIEATSSLQISATDICG